jgi:hypothetical protein
MRRLSLAALVLLLLAPELLAQSPRAVRPTISGTYAGNTPRVRLQQDPCFAWSTPVVARNGNTFTITQDVAPRSACENVVGSTDVPLEPLPAGVYRLVYRALPIGMGPIADYAQEFTMSTALVGARLLLTLPGNPTALEPVAAELSLLDGCETVTGVRPIQGGFAILIRREPVDPFLCDAVGEVQVTIGAFPPGRYSLRLMQVPEQGGADMGGTEFVVSPTTLGAVRTPWSDLSGLWTAADEEPSTALAFIHTLDRGSDGLLRDALVGIWYTYDASGAPTWYYVEANTDGASFGTRMAGTISRYRSTNPAAPGFQRITAGDVVGAFQLRVFDEERPGTITGMLNGRQFDIRLERFRWTRSGWVPPRNSP